MPLVSMKDMLNKALEGRYAVGQFNINNLEFIQAFLQAAQKEKSPIILGVSEPYVPYLGGFKCVVGMVESLMEYYQVNVAVHLDHGTSLDVCIKAIKAGFTSVMIDASHLTLEENIAVVRKVTEIAHTLGLSVEA